MRLRLTVLLASLASCTAFGQNYTISTFAGSPPPVNLPGTSVSTGGTGHVRLATDAAGNVYFPEQETILRWSATTGLLSLVAGNGTAGFSGDNGPATAAQLSLPEDVAVDAAGNIYIADTYNFRVRKVSNGVITTVAGTGVPGFSGDGGQATSAQLAYPSAVAVDSLGNLYIADYVNQRVRKVSGGVITTVAGTGAAGFSGDGGPATSAQLNSPIGLAVDSANNLYIADAGNCRVREVSGGVIGTLAGSNPVGPSCTYSAASGPASGSQVGIPTGVAIDSTGNVYIAGYGSSDIQEISNGTIATVAGNGVRGFSGDGGAAGNALLNSPFDVAVDRSGNVYIGDAGNNRIRRIAGGIITTIVGTSNFGGDNGPATAAQLFGVSGVAADPSGNVYIADTSDNRIREVSSSGVITTVAGYSLGGYTGDGGPAISAQLTGPLGVGVDASGDVYVADSDNCAIRKLTGTVITTVAGNGTCGFSGDNSAATHAQLNIPYSVALDSSGNLYIADTVNSRIRKVSTSGVITTVAGNGTAGFGGDTGSASGAQLYYPQGVAVDSANNLYIADTYNQRIRKVSTNGVITTVAGNGTAGFGGDGGSATGAQLNYPVGIAVDSSGNLYIGDTNNNRVRKVSSGGVINTVAGNGTPGFSGDNGPAGSAQLDAPSALAINAAGNVYVTDENNNRIRLLTPSASSSCAYSLNPTSLQASAAGGNFSVALQAAAGCAWTVSGLPGWITVSGANSGSGPATIALAVAPNTTGGALTATISIAGVSLTITQAGSQSAFACTNTTAPAITSMDSASSYGGYAYFASGTWLEIKGTNLADPADPRLTAATNPGQWTSSDFNGVNAPTTLDGISVSVNGKPAYVWYLSPTQINVQAPEDTATGKVALTVTNCKATSAPFQFERQTLAPGLLAPSNYSAGGTQYMVATFAADGAYVLNTSTGAAFGLNSRPAKPGDLIIAYGIGFGDVAPSILPGVIVQASNALVNPVAISFGSTPATVSYAGLAGGFVGLYEFYITVPPGLANGDYQINVTQNGTPVPQAMYLTVHN
jgi:uncharacterized protein (TIGR03437 family)